MITPQEIRTVTFDRSMRGYRTEDVDAFLQQAAETVEQLVAEKAENEQKLYILAQKIEEYRNDEDNLKTALLNAQRMGESVIKEAKQKAEFILREAGIKADDLTRCALEQVKDQEMELERAKSEVAQFKNSVLSLYKQHIESLTTLPGDEPEEEDYAAEEETDTAVEQPLEQLDQPAEQEEPEEQNQDPAETFPDLASLYGETEITQPEEEEESVTVWPDQTEEKAEEPKASIPGAFDGFQGIKFSD